MTILIALIVIICLIGFGMTMAVTKDDGENYNSKNSFSKMTAVYLILPVIAVILIGVIWLTGSL